MGIARNTPPSQKLPPSGEKSPPTTTQRRTLKPKKPLYPPRRILDSNKNASRVQTAAFTWVSRQETISALTHDDDDDWMEYEDDDRVVSRSSATKMATIATGGSV